MKAREIHRDGKMIDEDGRRSEVTAKDRILKMGQMYISWRTAALPELRFFSHNLA